MENPCLLKKNKTILGWVRFTYYFNVKVVATLCTKFEKYKARREEEEDYVYNLYIHA